MGILVIRSIRINSRSLKLWNLLYALTPSLFSSLIRIQLQTKPHHLPHTMDVILDLIETFWNGKKISPEEKKLNKLKQRARELLLLLWRKRRRRRCSCSSVLPPLPNGGDHPLCPNFPTTHLWHQFHVQSHRTKQVPKPVYVIEKFCSKRRKVAPFVRQPVTHLKRFHFIFAL